MMRIKFIPLIIMLAAGLTACVITYYNKYTVLDSFKIILLVLIIFYIIGSIVRKVFEKFLITKISSIQEEVQGDELDGEPALELTREQQTPGV